MSISANTDPSELILYDNMDCKGGESDDEQS